MATVVQPQVLSRPLNNRSEQLGQIVGAGIKLGRQQKKKRDLEKLTSDIAAGKFTDQAEIMGQIVRLADNPEEAQKLMTMFQSVQAPGRAQAIGQELGVPGAGQVQNLGELGAVAGIQRGQAATQQGRQTVKLSRDELTAKLDFQSDQLDQANKRIKLEQDKFEKANGFRSRELDISASRAQTAADALGVERKKLDVAEATEQGRKQEIQSKSIVDNADGTRTLVLVRKNGDITELPLGQGPEGLKELEADLLRIVTGVEPVNKANKKITLEDAQAGLAQLHPVGGLFGAIGSLAGGAQGGTLRGRNAANGGNATSSAARPFGEQQSTRRKLARLTQQDVRDIASGKKPKPEGVGLQEFITRAEELGIVFVGPETERAIQ